MEEKRAMISTQEDPAAQRKTQATLFAEEVKVLFFTNNTASLLTFASLSEIKCTMNSPWKKLFVSAR